MAEVLASVVIPTYNGEAYIRRLLEAVGSQVLGGVVEVLVIDSGSTDSTLRIVSDFPAVRVIEIPNSEFGHGRTRALGARETSGRYIAYLTQDAIPMDSYWLAELLAPFAIDERVALVTGRQDPRPSAFPLQRYEIEGVFARLGPPNAITLYGAGARPLDDQARDVASFHSDVNAAVRRDLVLGELPFRDVAYSEDQMMGRDALAAGWWKAYAGAAVVEHSNDLSLDEYGKRIFDETVGLRRIGTPIEPLGRVAQTRQTVRGILGDTQRIVRDPRYGRLSKLVWMFKNPRYQVRKWSSYRPASSVDLERDDLIQARSLEHSRKAAT